MVKALPQKLKKVEVYRLALNMHIKLSKLVLTYPVQEQENLIDQAFRSSKSITLNIAKGVQLYSGNRVSSFSDAMGSAQETIGTLYLARELGYIDDVLTKALLKELQRIIELLWLDIKSNYTKETNISFGSEEVHSTQLFKDCLKLIKLTYAYGERQPGKMFEMHLEKCATSVLLNVCESYQVYEGNRVKRFNDAYKALQQIKNEFNLIAASNDSKDLLVEEMKALIDLIDQELTEVFVEAVS